jgi:hypothetical protein
MADEHERDLGRAADIVCKEMRTFIETYFYLWKRQEMSRDGDSYLKQLAYLTMVFTSVRALGEFLVGRQSRSANGSNPAPRRWSPNDIQPSDFVSGWDPWRYEAAPTLMNLTPLFDRRVAHLSWKRLGPDALATVDFASCTTMFGEFSTWVEANDGLYAHKFRGTYDYSVKVVEASAN